jgi:hypothetical protein
MLRSFAIVYAASRKLFCIGTAALHFTYDERMALSSAARGSDRRAHWGMFSPVRSVIVFLS